MLNACADQTLPAAVVAVISNVPGAHGLTRAHNAGVPALAFPKAEGESRREYDTRLAALVASYEPDFVILAGWMRLLTSSFLGAFPNRVINLHPALPGTFPGTHAIERAYAAFQRGEITQTGVMVHLVPDEGVDDGPVLATQTVPLLPEDNLRSFEARVHQIEHSLLVSTLQSLISHL